MMYKVKKAVEAAMNLLRKMFFHGKGYVKGCFINAYD